MDVPKHFEIITEKSNDIDVAEADLEQVTSVIDEQKYMNQSLSNDALYKQSMVDNLMNTGEMNQTFSDEIICSSLDENQNT